MEAEWPHITMPACRTVAAFSPEEAFTGTAGVRIRIAARFGPDPNARSGAGSGDDNKIRKVWFV